MAVIQGVQESQPAYNPMPEPLVPVPAASPMPDQLPVPGTLVKGNATYTDWDTGAVIPFSQIQENSKKIDSLKELRWQGKKVYKAAKRAGKEWEDAKRESFAFQGGTCSMLWDRLAEEKVV